MACTFRPAQEVRKTFHNLFPLLKDSKWSIRSPLEDDYQCIAWAACRTDVFMWPKEGVYWPPDVPFNETIAAFIKAFEKTGYKPCNNSNFEFGYQKVAIYATSDGLVKHMARQHFLGRGWLSKCGGYEDIIHADLESIEGDPSPYIGFTYGKAVKVLKRSWWQAIFHLCAFRAFFASFKFFLYRIMHPSWILDNIKNHLATIR